MEFYYDETHQDVLVLSVDGGLIAESADRFTTEIERYVDLGCRKLVVDCTRLTRISSYGIGTLVLLNKRMAEHDGDVKLAAVTGMVGKVLAMTGLGKAFQIYSTVDDALAAFGGADAGGEPADESGSRHPLLDDR